ncbi:hypothetical protein NDU88_002954 [Pleurodeles waltl]|uniref:Uncharacterized protein n=1 Tax=Pleurodeles waltl TaxID=8319 RepID=A0AAV7MR45_PLEWA|nr:hypothetical protein NDU88_002954 [Pleurodeles waltl]
MRTAGAVAVTAERTARLRELQRAARARCTEPGSLGPLRRDSPRHKEPSDPPKAVVRVKVLQERRDHASLTHGRETHPEGEDQRSTHWRKTRKEGVRRRQHKPELEKKGVHGDAIEKEEKR